MHTLTRRVRMIVNQGDTHSPTRTARAGGFAGTPSPTGLPAFYEFAVTVKGSPNPQTGYLLDIKTIDDAARNALTPHLLRAAQSQAQRDAQHDAQPGDPRRWLAHAASSLAAHLPTLHSLSLALTPFLSLDAPMPANQTLTLRQRFDFAAAHRLNVPSLSPEQNRALFGKCNNENGHGHNYQFEPAIILPEGSTLPVSAIEEACKATLLDRFDHKHLNEDCPEFDVNRGGVNPSVENIAHVFFRLLEPAIRALPDARLASITVWETDRTSATYTQA